MSSNNSAMCSPPTKRYEPSTLTPKELEHGPIDQPQPRQPQAQAEDQETAEPPEPAGEESQALAAPVQEPCRFHVGLEFPGQRAGLQDRDLRRELELLLYLRHHRGADGGGIAAAAHFDRELEEVVAALVHRLGAEVADPDGAEDEVLEVLVAEVDAADLEEAGGAVGVLDAREHGERSRPVFGFAISHEIARAPAQERRDVVGLERSHHQRADLALLRRLERLRV